MARKSLILLIITIILLMVLMFSAVGNCILWSNAKSLTQKVNTYRYNEGVIGFTKMFVTLVLKTDGNISFEDRLALENAVRGTKDNDIFLQWQKFTKAPDQEVGGEVKNLLQLLLEKINQ